MTLSRITNFIRSSWKSSTAATAAVLAWATVVVDSPSGPVTSHEWLALAIGLAGAGGVYVVTNGKKSPAGE